MGIASPLFPGILHTLAAQAQDTDQSKPPTITLEMIDQAAVLAAIGPLTDERKMTMIDGLVDNNGSYKAIRKLELPNFVAPAYVSSPAGCICQGPSGFCSAICVWKRRDQDRSGGTFLPASIATRI